MFIEKRGIIMDINKIKRRERRFYRKEENGEMVYGDTPITKPKKDTKKMVPEKKETELKSTREIPEKTLKSIKENKKLNSEEKQKIIDKILIDLKNRIDPDIDEIAEMIYSQLSVRDVNVTQESVKQVVQSNAHYRGSRNITGSTSTNTVKTKENYDFLNDREELEKVIDDVVEENKKEDIREKAKKEKIVEKAIQNAKEKKSKETTKKSEDNIKDKIVKNKESSKPKKEELKLDFGDDDAEDADSDDELGLKF
ncbi:MAG TPA: hypothetical protein PLK55_01455 [archaeon]|jgi:hypothetical protein|nr:hypothetical protein [archaeon]